MSFQTRIVQVTAARVMLGQAWLEIPVWCATDRLRGIIGQGGATSRFLAENMRFGKVQGTGLARPVISEISQPGTALPDFTLSILVDQLRQDGLMF